MMEAYGIEMYTIIPQGISSDEGFVGVCDARVVCVCVFVYLLVALAVPYDSPSRSGGEGNNLE